MRVTFCCSVRKGATYLLLLLIKISEHICHFLLLHKKECNISTPTPILSKSDHVCQSLLLFKKECNISTSTPVISKSEHVYLFLLLRKKGCNVSTPTPYRACLNICATFCCSVKKSATYLLLLL